MKKTLLICAAMMLANAAFSQGTIAFANRSGSSTTASPGQVVAPVYGADPLDPTHRISGNTSTGVPAGNTSYGAAPFLAQGAGGPTWTVTLWALENTAVTGDARQNNLQQLTVPSATTTMRTSTSGTFAGVWTTPSAAPSVPGITTGDQRATFQIRIWDTKGGTLTTWQQVLDPANDGVFRGYSDLFTVPYSLGGTLVPANPPPNMQGLTSFNVFQVPEPSVIALGVLGAGCLFLLRRRK
jgi:hypothetical protein